MKKKINQLFADLLGQIKDKKLRDAVVDAWVESAQNGGWKPNDLEKIPYTLLTDSKGINLIEHTIAVTKGACGLAQAMESTYSKMPFTINMDWLLAGGLLHDVGKCMEFTRQDGKYIKSHAGKCARHPVSGAIVASKFKNIPQEVINVIICHAKEGEGRPQRIESVLVNKADFAVFDPMVMKEKNLLIE